MPSIGAVATCLPEHHYEQAELVEAAARLIGLPPERDPALRRVFGRAGVRGRNLALPIEAYAGLKGLEARNRVWREVALGLGERAVRDVLAAAKVAPAEIGELVTTTITGIAVPSLDALLMNRLPLPDSLRRAPLFGLGCLGGAAGVARAADYLRAYPHEVAVLLAVELCSLTVQRDDVSVANVVSSGLFGDGAAAVLLAGDRHPLGARPPHVVDSRSVFFPDTERIMGWDVVDTGFKIVLSPEVPRLVREQLRPAVERLLAPHALSVGDVAAWIAHPGGPKVMDAMQEALDLDDDALEPSRRSLAEVGNLSSASVLFILAERLRDPAPPPGAVGVLLAMGPAFCAELVLLRW